MDARPDAHNTATATPLSAQEMAVLQAFLDCEGRVISRLEIARRAGLVGLNSRRCDSILVALRRALGPEAIRTVRSRGWMLEPTVLDEARRLLDA